MSGFFRIFALDMSKTASHYYNYELMKHINGDTQMTDVWRLPAIAPWEKKCTKHPTQKPLGLLSRIIMASTKPGAWVLDPFAGSSTTGIAANLLGRKFLGIEQDEEFANISVARRKEIEDIKTFATYKRKIPDIVKAEDTQTDVFTCNEPIIERLPFLEDESLGSKDDVLMYAIGETSRKKTEPIGKLAIGIKDGALDNVNINNIGYIMFHYWKNEKATPYKLLNTPRLVNKLNIPSGYMLRMNNSAEEFLLLEYDPNKPAEIANYDIKRVMRNGKGRYMLLVSSLSSLEYTAEPLM